MIDREIPWQKILEMPLNHADMFKQATIKEAKRWEVAVPSNLSITGKAREYSETRCCAEAASGKSRLLDKVKAK